MTLTLSADRFDATSSTAVRCIVNDADSKLAVFNALCRVYLHVIAVDVNGNTVDEYDNR